MISNIQQTKWQHFYIIQLELSVHMGKINVEDL